MVNNKATTNQMLIPFSLSALLPAIQLARIILIPKFSRGWKAGALCSCGAGECNIEIDEVKVMISKS